MEEGEFGFEEGIQDKLKGALSDLMENIRKFGVGKFAVILLMLLFAVWLFFLSPKPGRVSVSLFELDTENPVEGTIEVKDGGERALNCFLFMCNAIEVMATADGFAEFTAPSEKALTLVVDAGPEFESRPMPVTLSSGEQKNLEIGVPRSWRLSVDSTAPLSMGANCTKTITLKVRNDGNKDADVEFVGEGDLADFVQSSKKTVRQGAEEHFVVTVKSGADLGLKKGDLRIKHTRVSTSLSLTITEKPQLKILKPADEKIECTEQTCFADVIIVNSGGTEITDFNVNASDELNDLVEYLGSIDNTLQPGSEMKFQVKITAASIYTAGSIFLTGSCLYKKTILVTIENAS